MAIEQAYSKRRARQGERARRTQRRLSRLTQKLADCRRPPLQRARGQLMHIHVINPNTTRSMTLKIGAAAKAAASPGVEVSAVNPDFGPASIEGYFDEAFSVPGLIEEIARRATQTPSSSPVSTIPGSRRRDARRWRRFIGIGEAAFHMASLIAAKFSVVTTLFAFDRSDRTQSREVRAYLPLRPRPRRGSSSVVARRARLRRAAAHRTGNRARALRGRR